MKRSLHSLIALLCAIALVLSCACAGFAEGENDGKSLETLLAEYNAARTKGTNSRLKQWYDPEIFDLSDLPVYEPQFEVSGLIRNVGSQYVKESGLMDMWEAEFQSWHPNVTFQDSMKTTTSAIALLVSGKGDIAHMGRECTYDEFGSFSRECSAGYPMAISTCFGSRDVRGWTFSLAVFVNEANPIESLTMQQLDGIFGAARTGGWKGLNWDTSVARGEDLNIRYWGQVGLTDPEWCNARIQPYGYTLSYHFPDEFINKVFGGGERWNEDMVEYANSVDSETGLIVNGGTYIVQSVANDKYGIGYTGAPFLCEGTKMIALAKDANSPAYENSYENIHDATYPLTRNIYTYSNPLLAVNPLFNEFFRYIVSQQGQKLVAWDAKYVPFNANACAEQLDLLEASRLNSIEYFKASALALNIAGQPIECAVNPTDYMGTILVPIESVIAAKGGETVYDEAGYALTIKFNGHEYVIRNGNALMEIDGEPHTLALGVFKIEDTMMASLELLDVLGLESSFADDTVTVL